LRGTLSERDKFCFLMAAQLGPNVECPLIPTNVFGCVYMYQGILARVDPHEYHYLCTVSSLVVSYKFSVRTG